MKKKRKIKLADIEFMLCHVCLDEDVKDMPKQCKKCRCNVEKYIRLDGYVALAKTDKLASLAKRGQCPYFWEDK